MREGDLPYVNYYVLYMYLHDLHVSMYSRILLAEKREAFSVLYSICITYAYENDDILLSCLQTKRRP